MTAEWDVQKSIQAPNFYADVRDPGFSNQRSRRPGDKATLVLGTCLRICILEDGLCDSPFGWA